MMSEDIGLIQTDKIYEQYYAPYYKPNIWRNIFSYVQKYILEVTNLAK